MKPKHLEEILKQDAPAPDPAARIAARRAALAEFARVHAAPASEPATDKQSVFQALLGRLRLSRESQSRGRDSMAWYSRRMWVGGAASIGIAVVGSIVVWNSMRHDPALTARGTETSGAETTAPGREGDAARGPDSSESRLLQGESVSTPATDEISHDAGPKLAEPQRVDQERAQSRMDQSRQEKKLDQAARMRNFYPEAQLRKTIPASEAPEPPPSPAAAKVKDAQGNEVVVTGQRGALRSAMEVKREAFAYEGNKGLVTVAPAVPPYAEYEGRDKFQQFELNPVKQVLPDQDNTSTFSADVDTSSYSFVRKQLDQGVLPQKDSVRAEEMINYFDYAWPAADSRERPFQPTVVVSDSPWGKGRKLIHIGIKAYELPARQRPHANLVMLLDVSGSMSSPDKLPLVRQSMKLLLGSLKQTDTVAIVVYAGAAGMVLPPTPVGEKEKIVSALDSLTPGGSTAGAEGIELAYQLAEKNFNKEGVNRILLCTDGDFNVGIDSTNELKGFVERKREKGIFLSVLGFGQGNYRDELAQALAQNGNGVAAYIDTLSEAQKVLVQQAGSSLFTVAKDVKFQVEFNPASVAEYRLVGYETRALKREDFNNDAVDAGDVGAGHTVTAIYEITPVGAEVRMIEESRYAKKSPAAAAGKSNEYGFLKIRYKLPSDSKSQLIEQPIRADAPRVSAAINRDVEFSTAVAGFAQLLRGGAYTGSLGYDDVIRQALDARGEDAYGYRNEFVQLVRKAQTARGM